jgi:hypothetical protein
MLELCHAGAHNEYESFGVWFEANGPERIELDEILDRLLHPSTEVNSYIVNCVVVTFCDSKYSKTAVFKKITPGMRRIYSVFFNTKTARKWHIDCMESRDSPALRKIYVKVAHVKQRKASRILFKKKHEITSFYPTDVFW